MFKELTWIEAGLICSIVGVALCGAIDAGVKSYNQAGYERLNKLMDDNAAKQRQ